MTKVLTIDDYFPELEAMPIEPFQDHCIVQLKKSLAINKTRSGLIIPDDKTDEQRYNEEWHETLAKIICVGPAFSRDRNSLAPWPEGIIASPGDFVRIPQYMAGKFTAKTKDGGEVKCAFIKDTSLMGRIKAEEAMWFIQNVKTFEQIGDKKIRHGGLNGSE